MKIEHKNHNQEGNKPNPIRFRLRDVKGRKKERKKEKKKGKKKERLGTKVRRNHPVAVRPFRRTIS